MGSSNPVDTQSAARTTGGHPRPARRHVVVIPLGTVDELAVSVAAANIQAITGLLADVAPRRPDPVHALLPGRGQYNAIPILEELGRYHTTAHALTLGILGGDLCLPFLSHVFGEAQVNGKAAVVSLYRIRHGPEGKSIPASLFLERLVKIVLHEIAHVLGLLHCHAPGCLMTFALDLAQLDALPLRFCLECEERLAQRVLS